MTAETTAEAFRIQADHLLHGYEAVATRLMATLAARPRPGVPLAPALARRLARDEDDLPESMREMAARFPHEPYRRRLGAIAERLRRTRAYLAEQPGPQGGRYCEPGELLAELGELREALVADGLERLAFGAPAGLPLAGGDVRVPSRVARGPPARGGAPWPRGRRWTRRRRISRGRSRRA